jgi:DNA-binding response OmpR family regulator
MADFHPAILIAEDQIFIALEAERILQEAFDYKIEICRRDRLSPMLSEKRYALVILEYAGNAMEDTHNAALVRQSGSRLIWLIAGGDAASAAASFPDAPAIRKPFNDHEVLRVVAAHLTPEPET